MLIKSPLRILPSLPEPLTSSKSILFSITIFLTAGESVSLFLLERLTLSSLNSLVNISGSSPSGSKETLGFSFLISKLTTLFSSFLGSIFVIIFFSDVCVSF